MLNILLFKTTIQITHDLLFVHVLAYKDNLLHAVAVFFIPVSYYNLQLSRQAIPYPYQPFILISKPIIITYYTRLYHFFSLANKQSPL